MLEIKHNRISNTRSYDSEIAELWIDLPNGERLYFSDIEIFEYSSEEEIAQQIQHAKQRIIDGLKMLFVV
jgi:hypothetical protein